MRSKILPAFGAKRLSAVSANAVQDLVDGAVAAGYAPSTVRNTVLPLRAIYRRSVHRGELALNPTLKLALPAVRARRERVARPEEAAALIVALPLADRALWATALYAGLRRGELQALDWTDVEFEHSVIHVRRSWDQRTGPIEPKTRAGTRRVPLIGTLRTQLLAHRLHQGNGGRGFVFANSRGRPFDPGTILNRAHRVWNAAGLAPIGLHECRHTCAAFMIAAGINAKALGTYLGHASITITLDRYGHLLPGNEREAVRRLDTWLEPRQRASDRQPPW